MFASIEFSPFKDFFIQGEYSGHDFQAGIKYTYNNWGIRFGAQAIEDWAKDSAYSGNRRFALGISYLFDKYATAKRRPDILELARGAQAAEEPIVVTQGEEPIGEVSVSTGGRDIGVESGTGYKELSPEVKDLLGELRALREEREKAQKALLELREWLRDLKE
jgi:hypothetical protein